MYQLLPCALADSVAVQLPPRDVNLHTGWRMASKEKLDGDKAGKDMAKEARSILEKLAKKHPGTPWEPPADTTNQWISPAKMTDSPTLPLVADLNVYCYSFQRILAPHAARGPVVKDEAYFDGNDLAYQQTPRDIGAQGGNVALLDGSASWRDIKRMKIYRASHLWEADGAFGYW